MFIFLQNGNKLVFVWLFLSAGGQEEVEDMGTQVDLSTDEEQLQTGQNTFILLISDDKNIMILSQLHNAAFHLSVFFNLFFYNLTYILFKIFYFINIFPHKTI